MYSCYLNAEHIDFQKFVWSRSIPAVVSTLASLARFKGDEKNIGFLPPPALVKMRNKRTMQREDVRRAVEAARKSHGATNEAMIFGDNT